MSAEEREQLVDVYDALQLRIDDLIAGKEQFTDLTNGELFVQEFGDRVRYCMAWKRWLIWNGNNWKSDECGEIFALAKDFLRGMFLRVARITDHQRAVDLVKHLIKCESLRRRQSLVESASLERSVRITVITSYSIHYTKLYDIVIQLVRDLIYYMNKYLSIKKSCRRGRKNRRKAR